MALVSADTRISELLSELHQLIKQTQEERSRSEHNLVNIQKTHERMQTENKISPYYRTKLRGLYTTAKADAEAECNCQDSRPLPRLGAPPQNHETGRPNDSAAAVGHDSASLDRETRGKVSAPRACPQCPRSLREGPVARVPP
uniref:SAGA complex associated factor 29 n=1 Tax=Xenopus tropicalis TaxID=8364 RepID=A0A803JRM6_XENTR